MDYFDFASGSIRIQDGHMLVVLYDFLFRRNNLRNYTFGVRTRNFAPPAGFELLNEPNCERGGPPTMPAGKKPLLPVTVFTDYI